MLDRSKTYAYNSKQIKSGDSFICLPKGDQYIEEALLNGAVDVIHLDRKSFAVNANEYFDDPTQRVTLIGITGTNGKTSVAYFTSQLLEQLGHKVLTIGTINSSLTTPESWDLLNQIKHHADNGGTHVVLEVSSHGIDQFRVFDFDFNIKCLTNITQDHLDYHGTFENYKNTKLHFMNDYPGQAVFSDQCPLINSDDIQQLKGSFHIKNVSAALEICAKLGEDSDSLKQLLPQLVAPKGRFETVNAGQPFTVIIDFAHTPDALAHILEDALQLVSGNKDRLKVVFGCGGDRDRGKRAQMGKIAAEFSHQVYLTADNSRSEATLSIIEDIKEGVETQSVNQILLNRHDAISTAIAEAKADDLILIAGKGHETSQVCNGFSYVFNDFDVAYSEIIRQRRFHTPQTWVLNQPDAKADVLFISKKMMSLLKITYSQFKRAIPTPSIAKIKEYLAKIKGEKIIVFESNDRLPLSEVLIRVLQELGGQTEYVFDETASLEHNLVGLTLIEQSTAPIIIRINPKIGKLKKIIDIISPQHIVIGDLYTNQGFIEPNIIKSLQVITDESVHNALIWYFEQMADIKDVLELSVNAHEIQTSNWIDFLNLITEELLIKLEMYDHSPQDIIWRHLISCAWISKVNLDRQSSPLYVLDWDDDVIDINQKVRYFLNHPKTVFHYIYAPQNNQLLIDELNRNPTLNETQIIPLDDNLNESMQQYPDAIHVLWKQRSNSVSILEHIK